jgi:hypothetical protein
MIAWLLTLGTFPLAAQVPTPAPPPAAAATRDSGTVRPGMTEAQVQAAWGDPSGSRVRGDYKYLFFANGCQPACGIQDVVILERGQVVDAIVRDPRHRYDGVSSSPPGRTPAATVSTPTGSPSR